MVGSEIDDAQQSIPTYLGHADNRAQLVAYEYKSSSLCYLSVLCVSVVNDEPTLRPP